MTLSLKRELNAEAMLVVVMVLKIGGGAIPKGDAGAGANPSPVEVDIRVLDVAPLRTLPRSV
jgi:hypothetical protein